MQSFYPLPWYWYTSALSWFYFAKEVPTSYEEVTKTDIEAFKKFFHLMLDQGVYLAPSAYEAGFTSITHDNEVVAAIVTAAQSAFKKL